MFLSKIFDLRGRVCYNLNYVCVFSMDSRNLTSVSSVHSVHDILYTVYKSVHFCYIYQLKIL